MYDTVKAHIENFLDRVTPKEVLTEPVGSAGANAPAVWVAYLALRNQQRTDRKLVWLQVITTIVVISNVLVALAALFHWVP